MRKLVLHINEPGDMSAGIFPSRGTITFELNTQFSEEEVQDIKVFMSEIIPASVKNIVTQEEHEALLKKEEIYLCTICHQTPVDALDGYDTCPDCQTS